MRVGAPLASITVTLATLSVLSSASIATQPIATGPKSLLDAFNQNDTAMFVATAHRISAADVRRQLHSSIRRQQIAATLAAPVLKDAPRLVGTLAEIASQTDRTVSLSAARAAHLIVASLDPRRVDALELTRFELGAALSSWHAIARHPDHPLDVRVLALEISQQLAALLANKPGAVVSEIVSDPNPQMRQAAFELLPERLPPTLAKRVANALESESDPAAFIAAAASLCAPPLFSEPLPSSHSSNSNRNLTAEVKKHLADLVVMPQWRASARLDAVHCLSGTAAWTKSLQRSFTSSLPSHLTALVPKPSKPSKPPPKPMSQ